MTVRPLRRDEADLFRSLRLRALENAPDAFRETWAEALAQPSAYWAKLVRSVTEPGGQVMFVAEASGNSVGLVFGLFEVGHREIAHLGGMWVDPVARGQGIGQALVDAVVEWARAQSCRVVKLWVTERNDAAERLYRKSGFVVTQRRQPLRSGSPLQVIEMALVL